MVKKIKKELTRNNGTLTEAQFWSFIRSKLRNASRWWKPITQVRNDARRPYTDLNKRRKWEYECSICKKWWDAKETEVHHLVEAGSLKCAEDLPGFVERLFVEKEGLSLVCKKCHLTLSQNYMKNK